MKNMKKRKEEKEEKEHIKTCLNIFKAFFYS